MRTTIFLGAILCCVPFACGAQDLAPPTELDHCSVEHPTPCANACARGDDPACLVFAAMVPEPSWTLQLRTLDAGCAGHSGVACMVLGMRYLHGTHGFDASESLGLRYFRLGCAEAEPSACFNAGIHSYYRDHEPDRAVEYLERACARGDGEACFYAALIRIERDPSFTSTSNGTSLVAKACEAGFALGCTWLGDLARGMSDAERSKRATSTLSVACGAGLPAACDELDALAGTSPQPKVNEHD